MTKKKIEIESADWKHVVIFFQDSIDICGE